MKKTFKLGGDQEFSIMINQKPVSAEKLITSVNQGNDEPIRIQQTGEIGWDGYSDTGELRFEPSEDPEVITTHIKKLITKFYKMTKITELSTLSLIMPIGGHIHIELPDIMSNLEEANKEVAKADKKYKNLAKYLLPIVISENKANQIMRSSGAGKYGLLNDRRIEKKGDAYTLEVRSPNGEWLTSEKLTLSTFAYIKTVWNEIINNTKNTLIEELEITTNAQMETISSVITSNFKFMEKRPVELIKKKIKTFELYEKYKEQIDFILNIKEVIKEKQKYKYDINLGWNVKTNKNKLKLKDLQNEEVGDDKLYNFINIYTNGEYMTQEYANRIKKLQIENNYEIKNDYLIYGLKANRNNYILSKVHKGADYKIINFENTIQTEEDYNMVYKITEHLHNKHTQNIRNYTLIKNKIIKTDEKNLILIGIPKETRKNKIYNVFDKIIYKFENNKFEKEIINESLIKSDRNKSKLLNNLTKETICVESSSA